MAAVDLVELMGRRAVATGAAAATGGVPYSFQRTLMTRSDLDQALVTGLSFALHQAIGTTVQESIQAAAAAVLGDADGAAGHDVDRWSRTAIGLDLVAVGTGVAMQRLFGQRSGERLGRATARTAGQVVAVTGASGATVGLIQQATGFTGGVRAVGAVAGVTGLVAAQRERARRRGETVLEEQAIGLSELSGPRALAMGAAVALGASVLSGFEGSIATRVARAAAQVLPGSEAAWRPLGHLAALGLLSASARAGAQLVFRQIETHEFAIEPAIDVEPLFEEVSGGPGSLVDFRTLAKMGRRFVWTVRTPAVIEQVTGACDAFPIRVYVGLQSGATEQERVDLAIDELRRTGAFDRSWLMITTPTGTGYGNYAAAGALELLSRGDCANVVMQYGARPSPISLDRVSEGRAQVRMLVEAIAHELDQRPADERPTVVMFGESLGAWSSQDAFLHRGTQGLVDAGIDYAVWIGTPMESKWKEQVLHDVRSDVDRELVGVFNDIGEWDALTDDERERIRFVMITHHNDGVARFSPALAVQAPDWLGEPDARPSTIPRSQRWIPVTTFVQTLIDTKNAARVVPGRFDADGHDYRGDLVPFLNALLGFGASDDEQSRIVAALETEESRRTRWIQQRSTVGDSMAAIILDKVREQDPDSFERAVRAVGQDFATAHDEDGEHDE